MSGVTQQQLIDQVQAARDQMQAQMQATGAYHEQQLNGANQQIAQLSQLLDTVRTDQERLRRDSEAAFLELQRNSGQGPRPEREHRITFVSQKHYEGGKFLGSKAENFKSWARRVRIFCNSQAPGMRHALELAEAHARPINIGADHLELGSASLAMEADSRLHDFLATFTGEEALRIVDKHPDQGFEAWRQFKLRYSPDGGRL